MGFFVCGMMCRFGLMDIQEREKRLKILIKELHPTKNKDLDVSSLKSGSGKLKMVQHAIGQDMCQINQLNRRSNYG